MYVLFSNLSVPPTSSNNAAYIHVGTPPESVGQAEPPPSTSASKRTSAQHKSKKHRTKDANEEDMKQVTGAFMQAVSATAQKQPVHRCNSFFDFMAESAKELTPVQQDRLMHACHMALLEIKDV